MQTSFGFNLNLLLTFLLLLFVCPLNATFFEPITVKPPPSYEEYKSLVSPEVYKRLVDVYSNKTLLVVDKLKMLDDIFMSLSEETLKQLPTPKAFRKLQADVQEKIRDIYYNKRLSFEEKLKAMEDVMHSLTADQIKLIPLQPETPGLLDFELPVLIQFNGQIETYLLREYLSSDEFDALIKIIHNKNLTDTSKARMAGLFLHDVYEKRPESFPTPFEMKIRTHKLPLDDIELLLQSLNQTGTISPKMQIFDRLKEVVKEIKLSSQQLEQFGRLIRLVQRQNNANEL